VWAGARFVIVAALLHHRTITRPLLAAVFLAGLAPYLFGATAWLRVACLASSAALTRRGLVAADVSPRDATIAVAWAFGGQAGALALAWIAKAAIALLVGT
jgi:hypothetical protein